jgi:hypothetical protein
MSTNDVLTLIVAAAAVGASVVAILINNSVNKRAARSALTELTIRVSKKVADYQQLDENADKYLPSLELQVMIRQADDLVDQLGRRFPESIGITLAQALELVAADWWADRYWQMASTTKDRYFRAYTVSYWAIAIWRRGQRLPGWDMTETALAGLTEQSPEAHIVRGDICLLMGNWVKTDGLDEAHPASYWFEKADNEYKAIPVTDLRRGWSLDRVAQARGRPELPAENDSANS